MLKKTTLLIIVAVIMSFTLAGCIANKNSEGQKTSNTAPTPVSETISNEPAVNTEADQQAAVANDNKNEKAVAPEKNPPGDIPDSQVFVKYSSQVDGYELQVPEGWARSENGTDVNFIDKFDGIQVQTNLTTDTVTLDTIKQSKAVEIEKTGRAVKIKKTKEVKLDGGLAILITYDSNSDPEPVTGKQIRLENESYFFIKDGKIAELKLWAPLGADNVDQWKLISNSFKWR